MEMEIRLNENRFNSGTEMGSALLNESLRELGCGRGVLCDADGVLLCGNSVFSVARKLGYRVRVIDASADELIVVRRVDLSADSKKGLEMQFVDNLSQEKNLNWDADAVLSATNRCLSFNPFLWHGHSALVKELNIEDFLKDGTVLVQRKQQGVPDIDVRELTLFDD